ncbi:Uncharacterized membrane protein [Agrococcus baldri]|uniref:Uncharacterized membrane protein n=1 Tax=Agrococcus baldri TaxID=153730 RepID=A0AA94HQ05_9MICO|nr:hypothetical protein [Agrococcus baldri]SFS18820.1 Uncharacterized membrane protein [Agrococcus baldri]
MSRVDQLLSRRSLVLGIAGGMRSLTPLAVVALTPGAVPPWPLLERPWGKAALVALAVGELVGDKLAATPSRLSPPALVGRIGAAALAGAALGAGTGRRGAVARAAGVAAAGALLGAVGGYWGRRGIVEGTGMPDPAVALLEDAAAIALSRAAATR